MQKHSIDFKQVLNEQQLGVVTTGKGPILTIAGAGSGKTRTLTYRVAYLLDSGVSPHRILLLTFTNKAAREMISRVEALVPQDVKKIWGGTFHHIANRILRVHIPRLGFEPNYTILDQNDSRDLIESCMEELGHSRKDGVMPQGSVLGNIVSLSRNTRTPVEDVIEARYPFFGDHVEAILSIVRHYHEKKRRLHLLDFDDLLCFWLALLEEDRTIRSFYSDRFEYILVDEYQDTNKLQADIIDVMAERHRNLMVVGDDSQSIYSFRGANFANIIDFTGRYPDAEVHKLEYNYRSCPEILTLANEVILWNEKQYQKVLQPMKHSGTPPALIVTANVYEQAQFVANRIEQYLHNGMLPGEIAVLYRAHYHSMELQMDLSRRGIPFEVRSGIRFFEQAHIKDIVSYMKLLINPFDEIAWKRILQLVPGIGKKTSQRIFDHILREKTPFEALASGAGIPRVPKAAHGELNKLFTILGHLAQQADSEPPANLISATLAGGYQDYLRSRYTDSSGRQDDIRQFMEFAWQYESLRDLLQELALLSGTEPDVTAATEATDTVKLSTIHQAKGLEWSVVFIIWLVEGRFPNPNNFDTLDEEEEERRLFYVAITRARDDLFLCAPAMAKDSSGYIYSMQPSRFLREIPEHCYRKLDVMHPWGGYDTDL